jgi:penicillin-binding protein 1A
LLDPPPPRGAPARRDAAGGKDAKGKETKGKGAAAKDAGPAGPKRGTSTDTPDPGKRDRGAAGKPSPRAGAGSAAGGGRATGASRRAADSSGRQGRGAARHAGSGSGSGSGASRFRLPRLPLPRIRGWRVARWAAKWAMVLGIWGLVGLAAITAYFAYDLPDIERIALQERRPTTAVVAADGSALARYGDLAGDSVHVEDLPPHLVQAVLAIEDRRFHHHFGLDPIGILRAMFANIQAGAMVQGGSTITQQLAKNLFLTPERTLRRKVQEALLALWLEANYDKDDLLSAYLNRVYLGAGTYGVDAAARTYFGVSARNVTLRQAAILAGLLRAPSRYSPSNAPELAEARADTVLAAMVDAGFISQAQADQAEDLPPLPRRRPTTGQGGRYFADWVADQVPDFVGYDARDMTVLSTLEPVLQRQAEAIVARMLAQEGAAAGAGQAAVVLMRHDGAVVAMVGGRSYAASQYNRATQARRQPGSAFKPIVFLAALEAGLEPGSPVRDAPVRVGDWQPDNFNGRYLGTVPAIEALARSANAAAVRVLDYAGVDRAIALARRMGLSGELPRDLSLALGTGEVSLLELTAAYAAIPRRGQAVWPYGVEAILGRDGAALYRREGSGAGRATSAEHAAELTAMMAAVIEHGTGRAAALDRPAAGKTGTSQAHRDAWFVGFTADYVCGVWVGNDDGTPMDGVTGGGLPARIWREVMTMAHEGLPVRPLPARSAPPVPALNLTPVGEAGGGAEDALDRDGFSALLERMGDEPRD